MPGSLTSGSRIGHDLSSVSSVLTRIPKNRRSIFPYSSSALTFPYPGSTLDLDFVSNKGYSTPTGITNPFNIATFTCPSGSRGYFGRDGLYHTAAAGVPRITYWDGSSNTNLVGNNIYGGLFIHPSASIPGLWNRNLTNGVWVANNVDVQLNATGIDGVSNSCCTLTALADNATLLQSVSGLSVGTYYSFCPWIKRVTGTGTISITMNNGTSWTVATSTLTYFTNNNIYTNNQTTAIIGFKLATTGDSCVVDFATFWTNTMPYIMPVETQGTSVSVTAETCVIPSLIAEKIINKDQGTIFIILQKTGIYNLGGNPAGNIFNTAGGNIISGINVNNDVYLLAKGTTVYPYQAGNSLSRSSVYCVSWKTDGTIYTVTYEDGGLQRMSSQGNNIPNSSIGTVTLAVGRLPVRRIVYFPKALPPGVCDSLCKQFNYGLF